MARRRFSKLSWYEPVRLRRPPPRRLFKMLYPIMLRAMVSGAALAVALHALAVALVPAAVAMIPLLQYYATAILAMPAAVLLLGGLTVLIPRSITFKPKHIVIVNGSTTTVIDGHTLLGWRIIALTSSVANDTLVRVTYKRKDGRRRHTTLGLSPKVDLTDIDRALRRMTKLGRWKNRDAGCRATAPAEARCAR